MDHAGRYSLLRRRPVTRWALGLALLYALGLVVYWAAGGGTTWNEIKAPPWSSARARALSGTERGLAPPVALGRHGRVVEAEAFYAAAIGTRVVRDAGASGGRAISHTSAYNVGAFIRRVDEQLPFADYAIWARVRITNPNAPALIVGIIKRRTPFHQDATPLNSIRDDRYAWFNLGAVTHDRPQQLFQINAWLADTGSEGSLLLDRVALARVAPAGTS